MATGEVEVALQEVHCLNPASHIPFLPTDHTLVGECREEERVTQRVYHLISSPPLPSHVHSPFVYSSC